MADHGCTILLNHNQIEAFYESVRNPDIEELSRRDRFFEEIEREAPLHIEGANIVSTIPDIDINALMSETEAYAPVRNIPNRCIGFCLTHQGININIGYGGYNVRPFDVKWGLSFNFLKKTISSTQFFDVRISYAFIKRLYLIMV